MLEQSNAPHMITPKPPWPRTPLTLLSMITYQVPITRRGIGASAGTAAFVFGCVCFGCSSPDSATSTRLSGLKVPFLLGFPFTASCASFAAPYCSRIQTTMLSDGDARGCHHAALRWSVKPLKSIRSSCRCPAQDVWDTLHRYLSDQLASLLTIDSVL